MKVVSIFSFILVFLNLPGFCCTDFALTAGDGSRVNGRSMEFAQDLQSAIVLHPRGEKVESPAPDGMGGVDWKSKYAFIGLNVLGLDTVTDGFNEHGLSMGALWLPGTEYQSVPKKEEQHSLEIMYVGSWILGNFATVDEVKESLGKVFIWGDKVKALGKVPPLHLSIHDAQGKSLVIEFWKGEVKLYDNEVQVLTNYPTFDWHLTNLSNFVNLHALNAGQTTLDGMVLGPMGQGSGLLGIPGDWTPPSRFVRIANFKSFAKKPNNAKEAVNLAIHLLNTVDIPLGDVRGEGKGQPLGDYTQWIVVKDLTNKVLYYRTYQDQSLHKIELSTQTLTEPKTWSMSKESI